MKFKKIINELYLESHFLLMFFAPILWGYFMDGGDNTARYLIPFGIFGLFAITTMDIIPFIADEEEESEDA